MRLTLSATTLVRQRQLRLLNNIQTDKWANRRTDRRTERSVYMFRAYFSIASYSLANEYVVRLFVRLFKRTYRTFYALTRWRHFVDVWNDHRQLDLHIATPQQRLRFNDDNSNEPWHMWGPLPSLALALSLSIPLKLPKILMKSVVCVARSQRSLFRVS